MTPSPGRFRRFRDLWRARRDGRRDGRRGIPTSREPSHPPALVQIAQRAHEALAELATSVATDEADTPRAARRRRASAKRRRVRRRRRSPDDRRGPAAARLRLVHRQGFPGSRSAGQPSAMYVAAIVAIVIAEFPLNAIAFRLFGEAEVLTWVMTASLAVTLVLCAHGLGSFLRQQHPTMAERRWIYVLIALPVLTIVAIAVIRARYLSVSAELTGLDTLGPVVGSAAFLIINLLVYTGATMLSYLAHAPKDRRRGARRTEAADGRRAARAQGRDAARPRAGAAAVSRRRARPRRR